MNITEFKEGDIITRTEFLEWPRRVKDFVGDRMVLIAVGEKSKMIFMRDDWDQYVRISFAEARYDEGWEYWPVASKKEREEKRAKEEKERQEEEKRKKKEKKIAEEARKNTLWYKITSFFKS